mmetsp:Transcript_36226/g.86722  ORF Transcript_36226/g.86722 Transcript_36226/m.86722 type:complete len:165 (-) Transcript_36226:101-595(-)|eukprot:CAMPEP_0181435696 /NCGR_PEP_ID=MMETSP1110-20121109/20467_1 /TAXON_ID=174948 /ORGANISM="Symbiodinium sp., Strain CCMP421" /LENGTH=164 /DNA_ID=CAMNT_0023559241 /DNA_START=24 /DNA_END=518 /DNA_ORIENTATION=-
MGCRSTRRRSWLLAAIAVLGLSACFCVAPRPHSKPSLALAAKGTAKGTGIEAEQKFDGILDELEEAALEQDLAKEDEEEVEDSFAGIKESFGWVLVADVFIIIGLAIWLVVGASLKQFFNFEPVIATFMMYWDPYFQSLLGVLFAARITGLVIGWIAGGAKANS